MEFVQRDEIIITQTPKGDVQGGGADSAQKGLTISFICRRTKAKLEFELSNIPGLSSDIHPLDEGNHD